MSRGPSVLTPHEAEIRQLYEVDGLLEDQIAQIYGVSQRNVREWLSAKGIRRRDLAIAGTPGTVFGTLSRPVRFIEMERRHKRDLASYGPEYRQAANIQVRVADLVAASEYLMVDGQSMATELGNLIREGLEARQAQRIKRAAE